MPCWDCQGLLSHRELVAAVAWYLCDDCRERRIGRRLQGALAESPPKVASRGPAGPEAARAVNDTPPSPPPGARPEPDPALDLGDFADIVGALA